MQADEVMDELGGAVDRIADFLADQFFARVAGDMSLVTGFLATCDAQVDEALAKQGLEETEADAMKAKIMSAFMRAVEGRIVVTAKPAGRA